MNWLRSVYSEADGNGSSARVHIGLIVIFTLGVGISFAVGVRHKTITLDQFDTFLSSASIFITSTCGSLYAMNKLADYGKNALEKPTPAPTISNSLVVLPVPTEVTNASSQP